MSKEYNNFENYYSKLNQALKTINKELIDELYKTIKSFLNSEAKIFIIGNGGSQSNASHICGDYLKTFIVLGFRFNIICPGDNSSYA